MDWAERMNRVVDYVEANLAQRVDEEAVARIAACPYPLFQHAFAQAAGVSLSEYARRRRLTMAAYDLQNTDERVIDVAAKYGYDSSDAFRVAFRRLHGVTPTQARRGGVRLTFYCRLRFELKIQGVDSMDYILEKRDAFQVVGVRRTTPYGGGTWAIVKSDGSNERMRSLCGKFFDLGLCFGFGEDGSNDYMCAVEWPEEIDGFDAYRYPESTWIRFEAKGRITDNTLGAVWRRVNEEFFPQSRYVKGGRSGLPTIEKYVMWDEAADRCDVEIWIPVDERK
ncbi:MAG: AraC family transcriptional regulator [Clostridia bacterium]|nr:AraC family transcriptional regulator [Clostridia bacterium]